MSGRDEFLPDRAVTKPLDELELELRRVPGVTGIGFTSEEELLVIHVATSAAFADRNTLRRLIAQQARALGEGPLAIEIASVPAPAAAAEEIVVDVTEIARPERVRLLEVEVEDHTLDVVVRLEHQGRHAVGRGEAGSPSDAALATMRALHALGADVPFRVEASSTALGLRDDDQAVVVLLHPKADDHGRYGVARASTMEEAACRATLDALNRWLDHEGAFATA